MCTISDYSDLKMDPFHRSILERELEWWHDAYLPIHGTVLDIGAGNGETARFYLNHGARVVICIEPDADLLYENYGRDPRVVIIPYAVDRIKSDCENGEAGMVVETHFPLLLERIQTPPGINLDPRVNCWRFKEGAMKGLLWPQICQGFRGFSHPIELFSRWKERHGKK